MRQIILFLVLLLWIVPLHAQDDLSPYDIALQRIRKVQEANLTTLFLYNLGLTELPPEIGQLSNLNILLLYDNQLSALPPEIGQLSNLRILNLSNNELTALPPEIGLLSNLQELTLENNQVITLPLEIGQLNNLCVLDLDDNNLRHLPATLGNLYLLAQAKECNDIPPRLSVSNNPLISPPPEVVEQGTAAILAYLRNQAWYHIQRWIIGMAAGVGLLTLFMLGFRFKQRSSKMKNKRNPHP